MRDEFQANFEAGFFVDEWSGEAEVKRKQRGAAVLKKRPPERYPTRPTRPRPRTIIPYVARGGFYTQPYSSEPFAIESGGSEKIRWIQECLNHKSGLQLPVNGIAGRETRSAIRDFQRKQGVRMNGLIDPDTERALRELCRQVDSNVAAGQTEEEIGHPDLGKLTISLIWKSKRKKNNEDPCLFSLEEAINAVDPQEGGVYIVVGDAKTNLINKKKNAGLCSSCGQDCVLKVGITEVFRTRFAEYRRPQWPGGCEWKNLRVYMAKIDTFYSLDRYVERALDQLLRKFNYQLPGSRPVRGQPVKSNIKINQILPTGSTLQKNIKMASLTLNRGTHFREKNQSEISFGSDVAGSKPCSCKLSSQKCTCNRCTKKTCQSCGSAPCQCGSHICVPGCSCARCKQKHMPGSVSGNWQRYGNQLQVAGV